MAITAGTLVCTQCNNVLPEPKEAGTARVCDRCGKVRVCPPIAEWHPRMPFFLAMRYLQRMRKAVTPANWPHFLLRGPYAGFDGVPYAATVDDIWPRAMREFDEWVAKGSPGTETQHIPNPVIPGATS